MNSKTKTGSPDWRGFFKFLFKPTRLLAVVALVFTAACGDGGGGTTTYTVGVDVSGFTGTVVLQNNSGDDLSITADGTFTFATELADGSTYTVTVSTQPAGQTCSVTSGSGTISGANVTNVYVTCISAGSGYTVGVDVSGLTGTLVLQNNGSYDLSIIADGAFTFATELADGSTYAVMVSTQPSGQTCSVTIGSGTISGADVTSVTVDCVDSPTYTVGGDVSGLTGTVVLQNNGSDDLSIINANGAFTFATEFADGSTYAVTVSTQPDGQTCSVTIGSGTINGADIMNVTVACEDFIISRVSVASDGTEGDSDSSSPSVSGDGRYVAFHSDATNLVAGDTNGQRDVFVYDMQTRVTTRVSVASDGTEGDSSSGYSESISGAGRYVAFHSDASNLVAGDTNGQRDVFVYDMQTGVTTRVSVASDGTEGDNWSSFPSINGDGRYVAFRSDASNLVAGDTNGQRDVFVHDTQTGVTTRISVASDETEGDSWSSYPSISGAGRYVAFESSSTNLVVGDTNGQRDVFVHDTQTGVTTRVSVASDGTEGDSWSSYPSISGAGRYVAFESSSTNLVVGDTNGQWDVFVYDTQTGVTTRVSVASDGMEGDSSSGYSESPPSVSGAGRYVAFESSATNLVAGDTNGQWDVFVHDTQTGVTTRVSVASDGTEGNGSSPSISADGQYVAFGSWATTLVAGDTNAANDIFRAPNPLVTAP